MAMRCRSGMTTGEPKLFRYILELGKYDMSYDVRDKTRLLRSAASTRMQCTPTVHAPERTAAVRVEPHHGKHRCRRPSY